MTSTATIAIRLIFAASLALVVAGLGGCSARADAPSGTTPPTVAEAPPPDRDEIVADPPGEPRIEPQPNDSADTPAETPPDDLPPALTHYMGREIAQTMHYLGAPWLVRDVREREEECSTLIKVLDVQPGQVICDLGCGNGFYTLKLARLTGDKGRVLAVDIQPEMLHMLSEQAKLEEVTNIELIQGTLADPKLPEGTLDLVLMVDVYHELSHPVHILAAVKKSLKPTGKLVLVEFRAEDPNVPIKPLHKMSKEQVLKELVPNGFTLDKQFDELPWQHVMWFRRDDAQPPPPESDDPFEESAGVAP